MFTSNNISILSHFIIYCTESGISTFFIAELTAANEETVEHEPELPSFFDNNDDNDDDDNDDREQGYGRTDKGQCF